MLKRTRAQRKIYPNSTIVELPPSLLMEIFRRLPRYSLLQATLVCRRWNAVLSDSALLDSFTLRVNPETDEKNCLEYEYHLSRTERKYRKADIVISEQRSFMVAVMALCKFGQHLAELKLTLNQCHFPTYFQLHYHRMKELCMGLEEFDQVLWEQEVDSYDACLRPIARSKREELLNLPGFEETTLDYRRIEEVFLAFVYRHCFRLKKLKIKHLKNFWDTRTKVLLYEGTEMECLSELEINGTGFIILADSPLLRHLTIQGITTGLPFYSGFRNAFPLLTHLEIINDLLFDNQCLWVISKRCANLVELTLSFFSNKVSQQAFHYVHRLRQLKKLSISQQGPSRSADYTFDDWPAMTIERLYISTHELRVDNIREMMLRNQNLVEFVVSTRRRIAYSTLNKLQQSKPSCRLTYQQRIDTR